MSSYGIVNTIEAPKLAGASQPELIKIEVDYSAYVECVEDVNSGKKSSPRIKPASILQCMKPRLLRSLCMLGRIDGASSSDDATDESFKVWLNSRIDSTL